MWPPVSPGKAVKYETDVRQLGAMQRPGAEGEYAADILAKVPPSIATNQEILGKLTPILQQAAHGGFVPEVSLSQNGYTIDLKNPGMASEASTLGQQRGQRRPLGGGGPAPRRGGGNVGVPTPTGQYFDLGNGQYADPQGNIVDALPAGATTQPATVVPAEEPMRGQGAPSLSIENFPGATADDFELMAAELGARQKQRIEAETKREEAALAARTLSADDRTALRKMIPAKAMLKVLEQYALEGGEGVPSTLPKERVRGSARIAENLRQGETYQNWWDADPFLQGFRRLHVMGRPILARGIGDEQGNLAKDEQLVWDAVLAARSVPEVKDAMQQVRALVAEKEAMITAGKTGSTEPTPAPTPGGGQRMRTLSSGKTIIEEP
jgi:hypothetical protein